MKEKEVLVEITENLQLSNNQIAMIIDIEQKLINSRKVIIAHFENNIPFHDSLTSHLNFCSYRFAYTVIPKSGYEMLKNEGFDILRSKSLKKQIVNLYEITFNHLSSLETNHHRYSEEAVIKYLNQNTKFNPEGLAPLDWEAMLQDNFFEQNLRNMESWGTFVNGTRTFSLEESQRVLQLIINELDELE